MYNPSVTINSIRPVLDLNNCLRIANCALKNLNDLHDGEKNILAKLVRLNWIIHDLDNNPLIKPFVVKWRPPFFEIATGDTRAMALEFHPEIQSVSCVLSIKQSHCENFSNWTLVKDVEHLARLLDLKATDIMFDQQDYTQQELNWMEFGYASSAHHMHNEQQRLEMILNYLKQQPKNFQFDLAWLREPKNWSMFDSR